MCAVGGGGGGNGNVCTVCNAHSLLSMLLKCRTISFWFHPLPPTFSFFIFFFRFSYSLLYHYHHHHHHHHLFLHREGRWGTTDDLKNCFLHFSPLFFTAPWDLANSRPVHSLMLSSHLFLSALSSFPFHCALQDGFGQTC